MISFNNENYFFIRIRNQLWKMLVAYGGGMGVEPIGFLVTHGDQISFISTKSNKGLSAVFDKVPDLMEK